MSGFFKNLPTSIEIGGTEIPIKWDFRASIDFETAMQNPTLSAEAQTEALLQAYFEADQLDTLSNLVTEGFTEALFNAIFGFYQCGRKSGAAATEKQPSRPVYSFEHDAERIYAAFLEQYSIDLYTTQDLHWWKFRAMFTNLSDNCEIVKIMQIRGKSIDSSMSPKERRSLRKAKAAYALPDLRSDEQIEADFAEGIAIMF